uniref:Mitochondrial ribosomal protein L9 n=1 Tax=Anas platyrhynchos TaxID=8839 RepID=A0A8B9R151_ANAPL
HRAREEVPGAQQAPAAGAGRVRVPREQAAVRGGAAGEAPPGPPPPPVTPHPPGNEPQSGAGGCQRGRGGLPVPVLSPPPLGPVPPPQQQQEAGTTEVTQTQSGEKVRGGHGGGRGGARGGPGAQSPRPAPPSPRDGSPGATPLPPDTSAPPRAPPPPCPSLLPPPRAPPVPPQTLQFLRSCRLEVGMKNNVRWELTPDIVARQFLRNLRVAVPPHALRLPPEPITRWGEYWCDVTVNGLDTVRVPMAVTEFLRPRTRRRREQRAREEALLAAKREELL